MTGSCASLTVWPGWICGAVVVLRSSAVTASDVMLRFLSETSGHVRLGAAIRWLGEDLVCIGILDETAARLTFGKHECSVIGDARGLMHVVGDDDDGEVTRH